MRKIVLKDGNKEFPLGAGISIGSAAVNTIRLEGSKVEPEHASIKPKGDHIWIEDLNSRYGLTVNGKKVSRWALKKDDVIEIGGTALIYGEDDKPEPPPAAKKAAAPAADASKSAVKPAASKSSVTPAVKAPEKAKSGVTPAVKKSDDSTKSAAALKPAASKSGSVPAVGSGKSHPEIAPADPKISVKTLDPVSAKNLSSAGTANGSSSGLQSAVKDTISSSRNAVPKDSTSSSRNAVPVPQRGKSGLLGTVGTGSSSRNQVPASDGSSRRTLADASFASVSQAALEAVKERSGRSSVPQVDGSGKLKVIVAVLLLLVFILGVTTVVVLTRGTGGDAKMSSEEAEARERLKQKGPKDPRDLDYFQQKFFRLRTWSDVQALLGEPDMTLNDKIPVFEGSRGTYEIKGHEFRAWYIKDPFNTANTDSTVASILLFQGDAEGNITYLSSKMYSRMKLPPTENQTSPVAGENTALPAPVGVPVQPNPMMTPPKGPAPIPMPAPETAPGPGPAPVEK